MSFEIFGGNRRYGADSDGEFGLFSLINLLDWRMTGVGGVIIGGLWAAQAGAGYLAGAGITWSSSREAHYGPNTLLGGYSRYTPDFLLGSSYIHAKAGSHLHMKIDADIEVGEIDVYLWRVPGMDNTGDTKISKSGAQEFDIPIKEDGYYRVMHSAREIWTPGRKSPDTRVMTDLSYTLSWKLES